VDALIDVAIVGGGITGLSAAYELQRRGCATVVLEAGDRAGGVIRTERFDGWVVDCGPDAILAQKPAGVTLCRSRHRRPARHDAATAHRLRPARRPPASIGRGIVPRFPLVPRARVLVALHAGREGADGR
jgi:2-polyprenyl-6-methoxyphenol hydroxylase-like FAD-dependent oxidoreductase